MSIDDTIERVTKLCEGMSGWTESDVYKWSAVADEVPGLLAIVACLRAAGPGVERHLRDTPCALCRTCLAFESPGHTWEECARAQAARNEERIEREGDLIGRVEALKVKLATAADQQRETAAARDEALARAAEMQRISEIEIGAREIEIAARERAEAEAAHHKRMYEHAARLLPFNEETVREELLLRLEKAERNVAVLQEALSEIVTIRHDSSDALKALGDAHRVAERAISGTAATDIEKRLERMRAALEPFAALAPEEWTEHPCIKRCFRVGGPCLVEDGACVECGLRRSRDDEHIVHRGDLITYGQVRAAKAALDEEAKR